MLQAGGVNSVALEGTCGWAGGLEAGRTVLRIAQTALVGRCRVDNTDRRQRMKQITGLRVGKPDVTPDKPSHTPGVREGNALGNLEREPGYYSAGNILKGTARRSTGINP